MRGDWQKSLDSVTRSYCNSKLSEQCCVLCAQGTEETVILLASGKCEIICDLVSGST